MPSICGFELYALELPFRKPFRHAAHVRMSSDSLMLACLLDDGSIGYGEALPRDYVSGETRDGCLSLLAESILPRLLGRSFEDFGEVYAFLAECDGKAPVGWVSAETPQTAAWAAVDLALLDAFGHAFGAPVELAGPATWPAGLRYSVVASSGGGFAALKLLLKVRLAGFRQVKLKVGSEGAEEAVRLARRILGRRCDIRVDVNMAWDLAKALEMMPRLAALGVSSFEQPLAADDLEGLAELAERTGLHVMVDESLNDADSLERLIGMRACTAVNVRISKVGGLVAARQRCRRALGAGLMVQVGCQVGESSLLSAAQLKLLAAVPEVAYAEGCVGHHLLREDPAEPLLQFAAGGRPPQLPRGPGLGMRLDRSALQRLSVRSIRLGSLPPDADEA